jgi:hypothetical protein
MPTRHLTTTLPLIVYTQNSPFLVLIFERPQLWSGLHIGRVSILSYYSTIHTAAQTHSINFFHCQFALVSTNVSFQGHRALFYVKEVTIERVEEWDKEGHEQSA